MLGDIPYNGDISYNGNGPKQYTNTWQITGVRLNEATCRIATEIMQTYDLLVKICHSSNSWLYSLLSSPYNTTRSALHKHD